MSTSKETHEITLFHIYPKPDSYVPTNRYDTKVHFEKEIEETPVLTFIVKIEVLQSMNNTQGLCAINTLSKYELTISKEELSKYDNWHSLVQKSINECDKLYKENVKGTYLEGTDIPNA